MSNDPHLTVTLLGSRPAIHPDAWVAPTAVLAGAVSLARGSSIWYGTVLRADQGDIRIGQDSNIQDNCVAHTDPGFPVEVGARVSVGHGAVLHGCTIEDECLIGMSATIMNGAVIGAGSIVAAGALVPEGVKVPPGSLVAGVPGKVRRETTAEERHAILDNADVYQALRTLHRSARSEPRPEG